MDLRISKTKEALYDSVPELLSENPWEDITISMICDAAGISRSTFYSHFSTKEELLESTFNRMERLLVDNAPSSRGLISNSTFGFFPGFIMVMQTRKSAFLRQKHDKAAHFMATRTRAMIKNMIEMELENSVVKEMLRENDLVFLSGALSSKIREWVERGCVESQEEILGDMDKLVHKYIFS